MDGALWFTTAGEITPDTALPGLGFAAPTRPTCNEKLSKLASMQEVKRRHLLQAWEFDNG